MTHDLPTFKDIETAAKRLVGHAEKTPLLENAALNARVDTRVLIKAETLQRSGSFKFRGAFNRIVQLTPSQRSAGVVAFSSGNHGQGVAAAAALLGVRSIIVMPADAPAVKIEGVRRFGGEVRLYDRWTESREAIGAAIAAERGAVLVPPFEDRDVISGQGTVGLEIAEEAEARGVALEWLLCGASGGGLIAGISLALEAKSPQTQIVVVEPSGHDDHRRSLELGRPAPTDAPGDAPSICDSLLAPEPGQLTFAINRPRLAGALCVSDTQVRTAMRFAFETLKLVVEPGGAVSLAAVLSGALPADAGPVCLVLTGANVDPHLFAELLA